MRKNHFMSRSYSNTLATRNAVQSTLRSKRSVVGSSPTQVSSFFLLKKELSLLCTCLALLDSCTKRLSLKPNVHNVADKEVHTVYT